MNESEERFARILDEEIPPAEYRLEIGRICVLWGQLEAEARKLLWLRSFGYDRLDHAFALTAHVDLRTMLGAITAVAEIECGYDSEAMKAAVKLMTRIDKKLRPKRNKYVHWLWSKREGAWEQNLIASRKGLEVDWEARPLSDLEQLSEKIRTATLDVYRLHGLIIEGKSAKQLE